MGLTVGDLPHRKALLSGSGSGGGRPRLSSCRRVAGGLAIRLGLLGMKERLEMAGGVFNVISAPGKGMTLLAKIPRLLFPERDRAVKSDD
jgi:signal transduction histidine kinase